MQAGHTAGWVCKLTCAGISHGLNAQDKADVQPPYIQTLILYITRCSLFMLLVVLLLFCAAVWLCRCCCRWLSSLPPGWW
jgi:hypothetical protein